MDPVSIATIVFGAVSLIIEVHEYISTYRKASRDGSRDQELLIRSGKTLLKARARGGQQPSRGQLSTYLKLPWWRHI